MNRDLSTRPSESTSRRIVDLCCGILFILLAAAIVVLSEQSTLIGSIVAAVVVGGLGIEATFSAWRGKRSLLARIGPLP